jgi:plastocyanin
MALTKRQADPFCAKTPMKEEDVIVGAGGGLKNVIVYVSNGLSGRYDPPAAPAVVDQSACMYRPRVQGIMLGQPLQIKNSDQTLHNVHGYKGPSTLFNQAEIPGMPPMTKQLTAAGEIVKLKCDVHPWMTGWILVSTNPFFAVTGDSSFKLTGFPAGNYTSWRGGIRKPRRSRWPRTSRALVRSPSLSGRRPGRKTRLRFAVRARCCFTPASSTALRCDSLTPAHPHRRPGPRTGSSLACPDWPTCYGR